MRRRRRVGIMEAVNEARGLLRRSGFEIDAAAWLGEERDDETRDSEEQKWRAVWGVK